MSKPKEIGTLVVVVLKAQHLHQPSFYKQDPYAQVTFSGLTKRTKIDQKGGQHPVWDDELRFPVLADIGKDRENRVLEVACYKDEQRGDDILLGKGTVDVEETLKTGEFDDWIQLETSAGTRGEVYLEMTFYANSPPPLTRRPSKLSPFDRIARPGSYHPVPGQTPSNPSSKSSSPSASPQAGWSPMLSIERDSGRPAHSGSNALPPSLHPARGQPHPQPHQLSPPSSSPTSGMHLAGPKSRNDSLPPLPEDKDAPQSTGLGKKPGHLPTVLRPGRGGRPTPSQDGSRSASSGRPQPGLSLPGVETHRRSVSDTPSLYTTPPTPISLLQTPVQDSVFRHDMAGGVPPPFINVEDFLHDNTPPSFPVPSTSPHAHGREANNHVSDQHHISGAYAASSYGSNGQGQGYVRADSHSYSLAPPGHSQQTYLQTPTPSPHPPSYSTPPMQSLPHQALHQPNPPPTPQPQTYPLQPHGQSPQPSQQTFQPQQHNPHYPIQQQPYVPWSPQPYQQPHASVPSQTPQPQGTFSPPPQPPYSQSFSPQPMHLAPTSQPHQPPPLPQQGSQHQPYFSSPPPPPPPPHVPSQPTHPPSYFSPPPPPPPLPNQGGGQVSAPLAPSASVPPPQGPGTTPLGVQGQAMGTSTQPLTAAPTSSGGSTTSQTLANSSGLPRDVPRDGSEEEKHREEQRVQEEAERTKEETERDNAEVEMRRRAAEEERKRQEELKRQEEERVRLEALKRAEEEVRKRAEEEARRRVEEEARKRAEEEARRRAEEEARRRAEERRWEEQRRLEEERLKREEEARRRQEEAERRRLEEAEAERLWQVELARIRARAEQEAADAAFARAQFEAEEAERRRLEEADLLMARQAQEEAEREERLAAERRAQEEADREVARREQAHEEELERRREEERRRRVEEEDRELARKLDLELNLVSEEGRRTEQNGQSGRRQTTNGSVHVPGGW